MITSTISLLELCTFVLVLIGMFVTLLSLSMVQADIIRLRETPKFYKGSAKHRLAKRNVRAEGGKVLTMLFYVGAVGTAFFYPPRDGNPYNLGTVFAIGAILWSLLFMVVDTVMYIRDRSVISFLLEHPEIPAIDNPQISTLVRNEDGQDTLIVPVNVIESE